MTAFGSYLSFEWLKVTKRKMPAIIIALLMILLGIFFWGQGTQVRDVPNLIMPRGWLIALIFTAFFAPFFWPVLGGSWAGNEYGWGTVRMILTRRPYRIQQVMAALTALLLVLAVALVIALVVGSVAGFVVALLTKHDTFTSGALDATFFGALIRSFVAAWYVAAFYLVLAFTAATVFRSAAVGIGIGIGSTLAQFVIRGIFRSLGGIWNDIALHFPVVYTDNLVTQAAHSGLAQSGGLSSVSSDAPTGTNSVIALAIYMAIFFAITLVTVTRRDVTA